MYLYIRDYEKLDVHKRCSLDIAPHERERKRKRKTD